jgi:DNA-directed RNA polymerase specialized sigma24 family protein
VRRATDGEDIALIAFAEFCAGAAAGRFPDLTSRHDLWRLLFTLTVRRARDAARTETRGATVDLPDGDLDWLVGDEPDPAQAAEVADEVRHLLALLPGDDLRDAAADLLTGYTAAEVAERRGCGLRTVERRWHRVRQFWQAQE